MRRMSHFCGLCFLLVFGIFFSGVCRAEAEKEPGTDSAFVGRIPGYMITEYEKKFGVMRPKDESGDLEPVEGEYIRIVYSPLEGKQQSALAIIRAHDRSLQQKGCQTLLRDGENGYGSWVLKKEGKESYINVSVANDGEWYTLELLEKGDLYLDLTLPSSGDIQQGLIKNGKVALPILFDTAKATILPESFPLVAETCTALRALPGGTVAVEGHTDTQGTVAANQTLSEQRANAVRAMLVLCGIPEDRMLPRGFGQNKPVADNATEEGRQKNRRVELVLMK